MSDKSTYLIWIDLEMTGLDTQNDHILEIATIITDSQLNVVAEGPNLALHQPKSVLDLMDEWCTKTHSQSGLIERVLNSSISLQEAESQTLAFLKEHLSAKASPMCGNTICQDRRFLHRLMPTLEAYFHYRHIDVSTVKELAKMWSADLYKAFNKEAKHLALDDIKESIEELRYYREHFFKIAETTGEK